MPKWTTEQLLAITESGNLIVSAAAGAGKTAVLTERLCRLVQAGTPVEKLLVLTFTRAAAAEMKARIADRLSSLAESEADASKARDLRLQVSALDRAYITTIDAFCSRILTRHGHLIALPPTMRVADETELALLGSDAMDVTLTGLAIDHDPAWPLLLRAFGSERAATEAIQQMVRFLSTQPDPDGWMQHALDMARDEAATKQLLTDAVARAQKALRACLEPMRAARTLTAETAVLRVLDDDLTKLRALLLLGEYDEFRAALAAFSFQTLRFARGTTDAEKDPIRLPREALKDAIKQQRSLFLHSAQQEYTLALAAADVLAALFHATRAYLDAFSAAKREQGVLDFTDMEHMALKLLSFPEVAAEYRARFAHIAVDEYQDSNRLQEAILQAITQGNNLFLVGDVKQSIYRFRSAEPALFLEKLATYTGECGKRIDLSANFRSSSAVLDAVNRTFQAIMTAESAGIAYDERAMLRQGAPQPDGTVHLHLIERRLPDNTDETLIDAADAEIEARLVAEQIRLLMADARGVTDRATGENRPYRYQDFAVLLRVTTHAASFARQLALLGVPCYAQSTGGYFDALEVVLLLNWLRAIDNHRQDVPLLAAATSPLGGFSIQDLAGLRAAHRNGSLFDCLQESAADAGEDGRRARSFLDTLDTWRAESRLLPVEHLIARLMEDTGLYAEMGALPGGAKRQANLTALLEKAHAYERTGAHSLYGFLSYMERAEKTASVGAAQTAQADVVRILTMHKSKGLEYPVVFLCQLGKRFDKRDSRQPLIVHSTQGAGLRFIDGETGMRTDTLRRRALAAAVSEEVRAEEMRVLYVAMTRARNRLCLIGCVPDAAQFEQTAGQGLSAYEIETAATPLAWLVRAGAAEVTLHARLDWLQYTHSHTAPALPEPDPMITEAIQTRLNWTYPFLSEGQLPARAAISRLNDPNADINSMPEFQMPAFLAEERVTPALRGTDTHLILQHLPNQPLDEAAVFALAARLIGDNARASAVYARQIAAFTHSRLFLRMQQSPHVERELPISATVPARSVFAVDSEETVLLQGVIDCCFLEDGEWVVVDYKTDRIKAGETPGAVAAKHKGQIALYAETLARLTGRRVKERIVYLLLANEAMRL